MEHFFGPVGGLLLHGPCFPLNCLSPLLCLQDQCRSEDRGLKKEQSESFKPFRVVMNLMIVSNHLEDLSNWASNWFVRLEFLLKWVSNGYNVIRYHNHQGVCYDLAVLCSCTLSLLHCTRPTEAACNHISRSYQAALCPIYLQFAGITTSISLNASTFLSFLASTPRAMYTSAHKLPWSGHRMALGKAARRVFLYQEIDRNQLGPKYATCWHLHLRRHDKKKNSFSSGM